MKESLLNKATVGVHDEGSTLADRLLRRNLINVYFRNFIVKLDMITSDLFRDLACFPDDSNWLESDDIADDNLCDSLWRQAWLDDDEPLLSSACSKAVDSYLNRVHGAGRLPTLREVC